MHTTIKTLEIIAEDMRILAEKTPIHDLLGFEHASEATSWGWYNRWLYNEFQLMQTFGINEFNALDMRSKANG